jgi:hypothetical protein
MLSIFLLIQVRGHTLIKLEFLLFLYIFDQLNTLASMFTK